MFAGVGPSRLMIAKYSQAHAVFAIDINPAAVDYLGNIAATIFTNVVPLEGDSRQVMFTYPAPTAS